MNILQLCTYFAAGGGIQRHVVDLSAWLRSRGHSVSIGGTPGDWANTDEDGEFVPMEFSRVSGLDGSGNIDPIAVRLYYLVKTAWKVRRAVASRQIDLIHAHETAPALVARLATLGQGVPILMTYHGSEPERVRQVGRIGRIAADRVISPSHATSRALQFPGGVSAARSRVIGLGVTPCRPVDEREIRKFREELGIDHDAVLVSSLSRLAPQKGIDVMVEVVRRVVAQHGDVVFVVGGHGPQIDEARGWAADAGVASRIRFVGHVDDSALLLRSSDFYLLTSRWEALPISIVEAFRAGLPVIATDCGGVAELVSTDVGRLCAVEDVDGIAAAVLELARDPGLRRRLGAAALELSNEPRFCPDHVFEQFESEYRRVIGARDTRAG